MTESIPTDVLLPGVPRGLLIALAFLALAVLLGRVIRKLGRVIWAAVRLVRAWKHEFIYDDDSVQNVSSRRAVVRHYVCEAAWHLWGSDRYAGQRYRCEHPSGCDVFTLDLTRNNSDDSTRRKRVCSRHRCASSPNCGQMAVGTIEPFTQYQLPRLVCWDHLDHDDELEMAYFKPFAAFEEDWQHLDPETKRPLSLAVRLNNPGLLLAPPEKPAPLTSKEADIAAADADEE